MPRINIEDTWYTEDPRRGALIAAINLTTGKPEWGELLADGLMQKLWRMAQGCRQSAWKIPFERIRWVPFYDLAISQGLAEEVPEGVYVRGAKDAFGWLDKKAEAGKKGGEAKASKPKQTLADASERWQTLASSSSSSSSSEEEENTNTGGVGDFPEGSERGGGSKTKKGSSEGKKKTSQKVGTKYSEIFESAWRRYPKDDRGDKQVAWARFEEIPQAEQPLLESAIEPYLDYLRRNDRLKYTLHFCRFISRKDDQTQKWVEPWRQYARSAEEAGEPEYEGPHELGPHPEGEEAPEKGLVWSRRWDTWVNPLLPWANENNPFS